MHDHARQSVMNVMDRNQRRTLYIVLLLLLGSDLTYSFL